MSDSRKNRAKNSVKNKNKKKYQDSVRKKISVERVLKWDNPILKSTCEPIVDFSEVSDIVKDMTDSLLSFPSGVGLAASQIGVLKRIVILRLNRDSNLIKVLINPSIVEKSSKKQIYKEGCLSYPDFYIDVERPEKIKVEYKDINGESLEETFEKFEAVVVCHEIDHLSGVCKVGEAWIDNRDYEIVKRKYQSRKRICYSKKKDMLPKYE